MNEQKASLSNLITALQIFLKYGDPTYPTCCEHDVMHVCVDVERVSGKDKETLSLLGFEPGEYGTFYSFRYGSA